jgi:hypothetical protein
MAKRPTTPSIGNIIKDPSKHFRAPREVLADSRLTRDQKRRILDSWALDSQLIAVADDENMAGTERPGLREVKLALLELERGGGRPPMLSPSVGRASRVSRASPRRSRARQR